MPAALFRVKPHGDDRVVPVRLVAQLRQHHKRVRLRPRAKHRNRVVQIRQQPAKLPHGNAVLSANNLVQRPHADAQRQVRRPAPLKHRRRPRQNRDRTRRLQPPRLVIVQHLAPRRLLRHRKRIPNVRVARVERPDVLRRRLDLRRGKRHVNGLIAAPFRVVRNNAVKPRGAAQDAENRLLVADRVDDAVHDVHVVVVAVILQPLGFPHDGVLALISRVPVVRQQLQRVAVRVRLPTQLPQKTAELFTRHRYALVGKRLRDVEKNLKKPPVRALMPLRLRPASIALRHRAPVREIKSVALGCPVRAQIAQAELVEVRRAPVPHHQRLPVLVDNQRRLCLQKREQSCVFNSIRGVLMVLCPGLIL